MKFSLARLMLIVVLAALVAAIVAQNVRLRNENKRLSSVQGEIMHLLATEGHEQRLGQSILVNVLSDEPDSDVADFFREAPAASIYCGFRELPKSPSLKLAVFFSRQMSATGFVIVKGNSLEIVDTVLLICDDGGLDDEEYPNEVYGYQLHNREFTTFRIHPDGFRLDK